MAVDVALSTNSPVATLALKQVQPIPGDRHLAAFLVVRSGTFAAALPFIFERTAGDQFVDAIETLRHAEGGEARLGSVNGPDYIMMRSIDDDGLRIAGELHDPEDDAQHLAFGFVAQWAGMEPFVTGLRAALGLVKRRP